MRWKTIIAIGLCLPALAGAETVSVTSSAGVVAQGGASTITASVTPETNVQSVIVSYQNESGTDQIWSSPYSVSHQFNTPQLNLTVTATVKHSNGDPDTSATTTLSVVGLTLTGNATPTRAWPTTYTVQSNPNGITLSNVLYTYTSTDGVNKTSYSTTYNDANTDHDDKSTWSGAMVAPGTLSVSATVMGAAPAANKPVAITGRGWTTPITCAEDNEPAWGDPPICDTGELGENRDRDSNTPEWIFVPRGINDDFSTAMTFSQITSGPSAGWWYVASSSLKCQRETVINKYIKANGPALGGITFQQVNADQQCFTGDFLAAVKDHEYRGTPPTPRSWEGHQGRIEFKVQDPAQLIDPKMHVEGLMARSLADLKEAVKACVQYDESQVASYAGDDDQLINNGPNWGLGSGSFGYEFHAGWLGSSWSDCSCGPSSF